MKKIGIITFHSAHNYGAMLQVFALQKKIEQNISNDVKIINYRNKVIDNNYKLLNICGKNPLKIFFRLIKSLLYLNKNFKRYKEFNSFMNEKLNLSEEFNDISSLKYKYPQYDIYITGSDQIWNPNIVGEISDAYTLNFGTERIKRISYAASIGNSNIEEKYINDYKNKLSKLDNISVREEDAKKALEKIIDKPIEVVLDPTLLLTRKDWEEEIKEYKKESEKYILAYVVEEDAEYRKIVNYLSEKTGYKIIHFEKKNNFKNVLKSAYTEGPLQFVNYIKNAEFVVATSFHATVFSILFNKKFFIVPHKKTGSRVINLLYRLGIENRVYHNLEEFKKIDYNFETNWDIVGKKLDIEREKSIKWLKNSIEG